MSEWSEWVEHDGKGCPCVGQYVESENRNGEVIQHIAHGWLNARAGDGLEIDCWDWSLWIWLIANPDWQIIRYRIRRPKGLTILEELIADLPVPAPLVPA